MPDIASSVYIDSLLIAYQYAEKFYNQAVADVVAAEVRREEAMKIKDEALARLENAREKYETPEIKKDTGPWSDKATTNTNITFSTLSRPPTSPTRSSTPIRRGSFDNEETKVVRRLPIKKAIAESESSRKIIAETAEESAIVMNPNDEATIQEQPQSGQRQAMATPDTLLSPTAGHKKRPKMKKAMAESGSARKIAVEKVEESVAHPNGVTPNQEESQREQRQLNVPADSIPSPSTGYKKPSKVKKAIGESGSARKIMVDKVEESVVNPNGEAAFIEESQREQRQSNAPPDSILSPSTGHKKPPNLTRNSMVEKVEESVVNPNFDEGIRHVSQREIRQSIVPPDIILSPTAGHKKAPKIFLTNPESPRRRSLNAIVSPLPAVEAIKGIFTIAQGRNRDWFDKNFDCEAHGLVKRFYQATFSTKTNEKTKKVTVKTIVLNDEWSDLVTDTSQFQEMYIAKSPDNDTKPTFRDRAAEALVNPPQQDPLALFFAPKQTLKTNDIYYGGHWKVIDGEILEPPQLVKGQLRQCRVRFAFVGIDRQVIEAINKEL